MRTFYHVAAAITPRSQSAAVAMVSRSATMEDGLEGCQVCLRWSDPLSFDAPEIIRGRQGGDDIQMTQCDTKTIQEINDRFRKGDPTVPGTVVVTPGVQALLEGNGEGYDVLAREVQAFDEFTEDNDPHGEHDFGRFTYLGADCYWKIDQYNATYDGGSDDPADLEQTARVMTIMLPHEY